MKKEKMILVPAAFLMTAMLAFPVSELLTAVVMVIAIIQSRKV